MALHNFIQYFIQNFINNILHFGYLPLSSPKIRRRLVTLCWLKWTGGQGLGNFRLWWLTHTISHQINSGHPSGHTTQSMMKTVNQMFESLSNGNDYSSMSSAAFHVYVCNWVQSFRHNHRSGVISRETADFILFFC